MDQKRAAQELNVWCHLLGAAPTKLAEMPNAELEKRMDVVLRKYATPYRRQRLFEALEMILKDPKNKNVRKQLNSKISRSSHASLGQRIQGAVRTKGGAERGNYSLRKSISVNCEIDINVSM